jgi:phosphoribosylaminoimidazolecarboxamide formyltransferase/IMP cyclohydrolase
MAARRWRSRRRLAGEAYARTAAYDAAIAAWFAKQGGGRLPTSPGSIAGTLAADSALWREPASASRVLRQRHKARCGHRAAGAGQGAVLQQSGRHRCRDRMRRRVRTPRPWRSSSTPIRAASPVPPRLAEAWDLRSAAIPISPFGGIVAVNRTLDAAAAEKIAAILTEVIVAPRRDRGGDRGGGERRICGCC